MTPRDAIERAVPVFARHREIGLADLRDRLRHEGGLSEEEVDAILEFVPLAFGRGLLNGSGVTFTDYYVRIDGEGRERARKQLIAEPYFLEATMVAPMVMLTMGEETFSAVALRSAEVQAINEALNAGSAIEDLVASPPVLQWKQPGPGDRKPWWKFWS